MLDRLFPTKAANDYHGKPVAKWVFLVITLVTIGRSLIHIVAPDGGAQSIATIPIDSYGEAAAATVILMFALWGLSQLLMGFVYGIVLWRYQALIPLIYLLLVIEYGMRIILGLLKPIETTGTAPGGVGGNIIFVSLSVIMLVFSLLNTQQAERKV
jgi:hypothetical protein